MSKSWPMVPLGEVLTGRKETPSLSDLVNGTIKIISKIGFNEGKIQLRNDGETKTGMILIRPGDLVVSGINAAKGAIAIYGEESTEPIAATIHYGSYIPNKERADIKFLWWLLRSHTFKDILNEYVPGGIKTELKAKRLLPIPIPLPPLPEQQRIVARIEELAAKIEEARGLRRRTVEEEEALYSAGLTTILSDIEIKGHLGDVLLNKPRNGWSASCDNSENGISVLSLGAITGFNYRETEFKRTSLPTLNDAYYWLKEGDLLISRSNTPELVGHAAIYNGKPSPCIYSDLMMRLDIDNSKAIKQFVHKWLRSVPVRDYVRTNAKGTSPTMKKISQGIVMNIPFPSHIPLTEQRRIVAYLDNLQAKVDALKHLQAETQKELNALMPSVLDKAFKGELFD